MAKPRLAGAKPICRGTDRLLQRLVVQWLKNLERTASDWRDSGDLPWAYTERALLSVLAGAVWKLGGTAFEEYRSEKTTIRRGRKFTSSGRDDIYLKLDGQEFKGEAKFIWAPATRINLGAHARVKERLRIAVDDAGRCARDGQQRLGILFATPFIRTTGAAKVDACIDEWIEQVFEKVPCAAKGVVFPACVRESCTFDEILPGASVFIQRA